MVTAAITALTANVARRMRLSRGDVTSRVSPLSRTAEARSALKGALRRGSRVVALRGRQPPRDLGQVTERTRLRLWGPPGYPNGAATTALGGRVAPSRLTWAHCRRPYRADRWALPDGQERRELVKPRSRRLLD